MPPPPESPQGNPPTTRLWIGIAVIVFGVLAALDNLIPHHHGFFIQLWPLLLVVIGVSKLSRNQPERGLPGYVFILAGVFLLVVNFGGPNLVELIWPAFIVALGIFIVTKSLRKNRGVPPDLAAHEGFLSGTAIFGGSKRRPAGTDFKGGEMTAIFGGFELDLRNASPLDPQCRVDVFILFGGGEIRVPQGWTVIMKATTIAGALEDKTLHLPVEALETAPRPVLVLTGLALFGGLTVTN
jgi:hypothetical protein